MRWESPRGGTRAVSSQPNSTSFSEAVAPLRGPQPMGQVVAGWWVVDAENPVIYAGKKTSLVGKAGGSVEVIFLINHASGSPTAALQLAPGVVDRVSSSGPGVSDPTRRGSVGLAE